MCLGMAPRVKEQRSNKNQNELVMAVLKYGSDFYLQPVIKLPLLRFMEMLAPTEPDPFCQGHVYNLQRPFLNILADGHFV